jgi:hypothetical protein
MRTDYLNKTASTVLDANGNGSILLKPDVGQYWAPNFVRISTAKQVPPFPHCTIYHGASLTDQTTGPANYVDDTNLGNSDASSIIAGTTVQFGEAIYAKWTGGQPLDTAILTVYGTTADTPPSSGEAVPTTPGTHFAGRAISDATVAVLSATNQVLALQSTVSFGPVAVNNFSSFQMSLDTQNGAGSTNGYLRMTLIWSLDAAGTQIMWQEDHIVRSDPTIAHHYIGNGPMFSSFMTVTFLNYDTVAPATFSFQVQGSSRPRTVIKIREKWPPFFGTLGGLLVDNVLASYTGTLATGVTSGNLLMPYYHGPATLDIVATGQAASYKVVFTFQFEPTTEFGGTTGPGSWSLFDNSSTGSHPDIIQTEMAFPRRACKLQVKNNDVNTITYFALVTAQEW